MLKIKVIKYTLIKKNTLIKRNEIIKEIKEIIKKKIYCLNALKPKNKFPNALENLYGRLTMEKYFLANVMYLGVLIK